MKNLRHPLAEVFGFPADDMSAVAQRYRAKRLCPFNNKVPNCTKDKAQNPLGVCSVCHGDSIAITCPIRFRQEWRIADDAAGFFFGANAAWTALTEVRLKDASGASAGNIDMVLCAYDRHGAVYDFGALEIQAVYISGNIRNPFDAYIRAASQAGALDWRGEENYPHPDYLSSSRKRLAPQLMFKGGILHAWKKKTAVALDSGFFATLPKLEEASPEDADVAWFVYDLLPSPQAGEPHRLSLTRTVYTRFDTALAQITKPRIGLIADFLAHLQSKVDEKLETPPVNQTLEHPPGLG